MNLPIDVVPNTRPQRFKWKQMFRVGDGYRFIECEAELPAQVEDAVAALVALAKVQARQLELLRKDNEGLAAQLMAAQDEVVRLSKLANTPQGQPAPAKGRK